MGIGFSLMIIIGTLFTMVFVLRKIRKSDLQIEFAVSWIIWVFIMLIIALVPNQVYSLAIRVGFTSGSDAVLLLLIVFLLINVFNLTLMNSKLQQQNQKLAMKIALDEFQEEEI